MRVVLAVVAVAGALVVVGLSFLLWPPAEKEKAKPEVAARYLTNPALEAELAPVAQRFRGPEVLQVPAGYRCYVSQTQRFRRVVIVCAR